MRSIISGIILILFTFCYGSSFAITVSGDELHLGQVEFPTSTHSPIAQAHFNLGLKYLHNFMYQLALHEFQSAEKADPNFAMSYWGQAMCYKWSLWSYENKQKGIQVLKKFHARHSLTMTPLEKNMLSAISEIFKPGTDLENEKNYLSAMKKTYLANPTNPDIVSLYALAMIGYSMDDPYNKNSNQLVDQARALLKPFLKKYPAHPGINHYYMHANDMPNTRFPKQGLIVVPNVYKNLNDSSHVLHMAAHLYTALGWWRQAAHANDLSVQASHRMCNLLAHYEKTWTLKQKYACDADNVYHSLEWLQYDYLQMGKFTQANALLKEMQKVSKIENKPNFDFWTYRMQARQTLYSKHYRKVTALPKPLVEISKDKNWAAYSECGMLLADGVSAVHFHQKKFLPLIQNRFDSIISQLHNGSSAMYKDSCILAKTEVSAYQHAYLENNYDPRSNELYSVNHLQEKLQTSHASLTLPFLPGQEVFGAIMINHPKYYSKILELYKDELKFFPFRAAAMQGIETKRLTF